MNIRNIYLLPLIVLLAACSKSEHATLAPEALYADEGLTVITTQFNNRRQTTTILYGNAAALEASTTGNTGHTVGEDYRLVTWEQYGNPLWFGGNINGQIKSIERLTTIAAADGTINSRYELQKGKVENITDDSVVVERIRYISELKPLAFP